MSARITSHRNERVKAIKRLVLDAGERRRLGLCVVEGVRVARDVLDGGAAVTEALVSPHLETLEGGAGLLASLRSRLDAERLLEATDEVLASVSDTRAAQGAVLVLPRPAHDGLPRVAGAPVLVAWEIQDPGNVGSMVRTAEAGGCAAFVVAASENGALIDAFAPRAVRAAASASFRLPVHEWRGPARELLAGLRSGGARVAACVARGGKAPDAADLAGSVAMIIGSEAHGLPDAIASDADVSLTIPLAGAAESLNAAAAAAVVVFEAARQRRAR